MKVRSILSAAVVAVGLATAAHADVTGKVTYEGKAPAPKKVNMAAVPACAAQHPNGVTEETLVVGKNKELANVVVSLKNPPAGGKKPATPAMLDQKGCQYHPHVLGIMVGQDVMVKNSDPFLHNIHGLPETNEGFNFGQNNIDNGRSIAQKIKAPEYFRVKCDVHPWMSAWFAVFNHPYFGVSGEDGSFTIAGVPDGNYDIIAWHEKLGEQEGKVSVKGGKGELNIVMKPSEDANAAPAAPEKVLVLKASTNAGKEPCTDCCDEAKPAATATPAVVKR
jgi:plastocyanin